MKRALLALVAVVALVGCDKPGTYYNSVTGQVQVVQLHAEWELELPHFWDIKPPDRLDVIMWPDTMKIYEQPASVRCDNMGGELIFYPKTEQYICEGIDY